MVERALNKMAPAAGGCYVNRCACGGFMDVPCSGEVVVCQCGQAHVWPTQPLKMCERFHPSPDSVVYPESAMKRSGPVQIAVRVVRKPNPNV
jgi:hypothetical protein